ncbi:MAG: DUF4433 domain-containing protein [Methylococcales bacterium]|nr:DUF4433 domain-containing protein [Methylococcales bacterium]
MTIGIKPLYHFTDTRNIPSIKEHGLLSLAELKCWGIEIPAAGGNELSHNLDEERKLDEYVHLCCFTNHPMEWTAKQDERINQSRFLSIKPIVLEWEGVKFTLDVANKSGEPLLSFEQAKEKGMDIEIICSSSRLDNWKPRRDIAEKYEILVPNVIPVEFIIGGL